MMAEYFHDTDKEGVFVYERRENVDMALQGIKEARELQTGKPVPGLGYFAGSIPTIVAEAYCQKRGLSWEEFMGDSKHVVNLLNDPDYKALRVWGGRL